MIDIRECCIVNWKTALAGCLLILTVGGVVTHEVTIEQAQILFGLIAGTGLLIAKDSSDK
jgi:hypothetical protein